MVSEPPVMIRWLFHFWRVDRAFIFVLRRFTSVFALLLDSVAVSWRSLQCRLVLLPRSGSRSHCRRYETPRRDRRRFRSRGSPRHSDRRSSDADRSNRSDLVKSPCSRRTSLDLSPVLQFNLRLNLLFVTGAAVFAKSVARTSISPGSRIAFSLRYHWFFFADFDFEFDPMAASSSCSATSAIAESVVTFHVYSFSCFLFSSLIALALKQAIRISRFYSAYRPYVHKSGLRIGMLVSAVGSVAGCAFLMFALINVVQIKLGTLACGSPHAFGAVVPLVIFVPFGLLIYVSIVFYAFTR